MRNGYSFSFFLSLLTLKLVMYWYLILVYTLHYKFFCQMWDAGQTNSETVSGEGFIDFGASLQNHLNWSLLKESVRWLSSVLTCQAKTLLLKTKLLRIISLNKYIQFLQELTDWLIILTTAELSQKIVTLWFFSWFPQVNRAAVRANNSRYSILGLNPVM